MSQWRPDLLQHAARVLLWGMLLLIAATAANVAGIHLAGSLDSWRQWLKSHTDHFLIWRLLLYAGTAWGWLWMRRRVLAREPGGKAQPRLLRAEIATVLAVAAMEISQFVQAG
ncbi:MULTISPECIES: hypothetical protein [unclassified Pseudomonas]|uniref:hypothetical protein n=1 Tax=unclassified Pseudomonas TaxID=196821 RepID=UPI0024559B06|nr:MULTISPECIES: hypothetical protein [unclassified Pseudomonas]MDH4564495.1 hypothetical protein [Pseudomonas sp. BN411]MDH4655284.1 hypothetical protein [Pseudomonas sp. BN606]